MLNLVCFYRQTLVAAPWQVLEWAPSRCGQMHYTKAISFRADETFTVPRGSDNQLVVVWLDVHRSLWERLRTFLFRPASPILVDTGTGEFRMATTQVTGPLLMSIPTTVGWDGAFGGGVDYRSLRVNRDGTARFATVPLS
jgi:hypothetical protein